MTVDGKINVYNFAMMQHDSESLNYYIKTFEATYT